MPSVQTILRIQDLRLLRGQAGSQHQVLLPALELQAGHVCAIHGPSGCGKSTLLEALGLLLRPASLGYFELADFGDIASTVREKQSKPLTDMRAKAIGFVLQSGGLLPFLSVEGNIHLQRQWLGMPRRSALVDDAIARLNIGHLLPLKPSALSIGERQRVAFVRAIAHEPALLLADEPTSALDPINAHALFELFLEIIQSRPMAALVVSHDAHLLDHFQLERLQAEVGKGICRFSQAPQLAGAQA